MFPAPAIFRKWASAFPWDPHIAGRHSLPPPANTPQDCLGRRRHPRVPRSPKPSYVPLYVSSSTISPDSYDRRAHLSSPEQPTPPAFDPFSLLTPLPTSAPWPRKYARDTPTISSRLQPSSSMPSSHSLAATAPVAACSRDLPDGGFRPSTAQAQQVKQKIR